MAFDTHQKNNWPTRMTDEEHTLADTDPANLVPRVISLLPDDPEVQRLPKQYVGTDSVLYGESGA